MFQLQTLCDSKFGAQQRGQGNYPTLQTSRIRDLQLGQVPCTFRFVPITEGAPVRELLSDLPKGPELRQLTDRPRMDKDRAHECMAVLFSGR